MDQKWLNELKTLALNNRIAAIQRYREHTQVGLKEAMDAIQALLDTPTPGPIPTPIPSLSEEILRLITVGQKIEAIKRYQTLTGVGLKEAKDAVDAIEAGKKQHISPWSS